MDLHICINPSDNSISCGYNSFSLNFKIDVEVVSIALRASNICDCNNSTVALVLSTFLPSRPFASWFRNNANLFL
eukprot:Gb_33034 [translate_table: standard]